MGKALGETKQSGHLQLKGAIDISVAAELKATLIEALATEETIRVSLEAVSEIDVTGIQLLWVARREAKQRGLKFMLEGEMPLPVKSVLSDLGLEACAFFE
ncbi:MAG TPA: STAS domain-containing protein [Terracidiphilus sp.]|nr:STAS domain-containing protein [Terracidiphilus sp.]